MTGFQIRFNSTREIQTSLDIVFRVWNEKQIVFTLAKSPIRLAFELRRGLGKVRKGTKDKLLRYCYRLLNLKEGDITCSILFKKATIVVNGVDFDTEKIQDEVEKESEFPTIYSAHFISKTKY